MKKVFLQIGNGVAVSAIALAAFAGTMFLLAATVKAFLWAYELLPF